jgi:hypothetical protein
MIKTNQLPEKHIFVCENLREPFSSDLPVLLMAPDKSVQN